MEQRRGGGRSLNRGGRGRIITWMAISPHVRIRGSLSRAWSVNAHPHRLIVVTRPIASVVCTLGTTDRRIFDMHTHTARDSFFFVSTCPTMTAGRRARWNVHNVNGALFAASRRGCLSIKISTPSSTTTTSSWRAQIGCLEKEDLSHRVSHAIICYFRLRRTILLFLFSS